MKQTLRHLAILPVLTFGTALSVSYPATTGHAFVAHTSSLNPAPIVQKPPEPVVITTYVRASVPKQTAKATKPSGACSLDYIKSKESGGNYQAVSKSGKYRGAYQFDQRTWESNGGTGDPAAASPAEQDRIAAATYARRGSQPWSVCH